MIGCQGSKTDEAAGVGIDREAAERVARTIALRRLSASPRSRAELLETLTSRGIPVDVANSLLDRYEELGLIDDEQYAAMLVRARQSRGFAGPALSAQLAKKGIDREVAGQALAAVTPEAEVEAAESLVRKRLRAMSSLEVTVQRRRLIAMLGRRGYSAGLAYRVVNEVLDDEG
jgi:regulatory protein